MKHWLKAFVVGFWLAASLGAVLAAPAQAATVTVAVAGTADTTTSPNASAAFTPAENDLILVCVSASNTTQDPGTISDSTGMTFTQFAKAGFSAGATQRLYGFVSDSLVTAGQAVSQTVTANFVSDDFGGTVISVARVSGMAVAGLSAVRQFDITDDGTAAGTPATTFTTAGAALTGNPTIYCVGNETSPAGLTEPTNWTEGGDAGYATPTSGMEWAYRNSGFTGTTITSGGTSASAFDALAVEIAATTIPVFSAGPASGTITSTTIPTTFTLNETGTVHSTACLDGQAGSQAETKLGQCASGAAAPSAWSEAVVASVADSHTHTGLTPSTKYDLTFSGTGTTLDTAGVSSIADQTTTCGGTPSITSVDGDDSFDATDSSIAIVGTSLCITHATATVVLRDGSANDKTLTCSVFTNTSWTCSGASAVGVGVASGLLYGTLTLRFTNDAGNLGTRTVTVTVPSGTVETTLSGGIVTLGFDDDGNPFRLFGDPLDLQSTSHIAIRNVVGCLASEITVNADATLDVDADCTAFDWDFSRDGLYIGTVGTLAWAGGPPHMGVTDFTDHVLAVGLAMTSYDLDDYFTAGDAAASARAMRQLGSATDSTADVTPAVTLEQVWVVTDASPLVSFVGQWIRCGAGGIPVQLLWANPLTNEIQVRASRTCANNDSIFTLANGAGAISNVTVNSGTGVVSGSPDTDATTTGLLYRWTDASGVYAEARTPFQIDVVTIPDTTADTKAGATATLEALGLTVNATPACGAEAINQVLTQTPVSVLWGTDVNLTYSQCFGLLRHIFNRTRIGLGIGH